MNETGKSILRRVNDIRFSTKYFVGDGIDIGAGSDGLNKYQYLFPLMKSVRLWDQQDGDAEILHSIDNNQYDFVHSSHCIEHLNNPFRGMSSWIRVCKPGGHLIITVPDEDLYEQGCWPSTYSDNHKTSWTICKSNSWSQGSVNVVDLVNAYCHEVQVVKIELVDYMYMYGAPRFDQTLYGNSESAIEIIMRKK